MQSMESFRFKRQYNKYKYVQRYHHDHDTSVQNRKKRLLFFGTLMIFGQLAFFLVEFKTFDQFLLRNTHNNNNNNNQNRQLLELNSNHLDQYPFTNFLDVNYESSSSYEKIVDDGNTNNNNKTVGFYWQVPRCGGTTMKHIMGSCLRLVQAARTSSDYCDMNTLELQTCQTKVGRFVNADPSDHKGIQRATRMDLVPSGIPDVLISSRLLHAATLYDDVHHPGRIFTILRDPIERSVSTFYYLQNAYWERHYRPDLKEMTLLDYAALPETASNWMTRWLTGKNAEPVLTQSDVEFAKELLERKFLVMLTDKMATSIEMLLYYMGWEKTVYRISRDNYDDMRECLVANTKSDTSHWNKNQHFMPDVGTPEYRALYAINEFDMQLYEHAKKVFEKQAAMFSKKRKRKVRNLFIKSSKQDDDNNNNQDDDQGTQQLLNATKRSDYEAAQVAANLMERPPEEASHKSIEATNSLVATALMMINPNSTSVIMNKVKEEKDMISSSLAQQSGANRWGAAANKKKSSSSLLFVQGFTLLGDDEASSSFPEDDDIDDGTDEELMNDELSATTSNTNEDIIPSDNKTVPISVAEARVLFSSQEQQQPVVSSLFTNSHSSFRRRTTTTVVENNQKESLAREEEEEHNEQPLDLLSALVTDRTSSFGATTDDSFSKVLSERLAGYNKKEDPAVDRTTTTNSTTTTTTTTTPNEKQPDLAHVNELLSELEMA